ncbi:putative bifunctional diguanylate cyclase/phosphodiesterase [Glaciimonas sp. GG7]
MLKTVHPLQQPTLEGLSTRETVSPRQAGPNLHSPASSSLFSVRPRDPQALRMRRFYMAAGTSLLAICLMFACYVEGVLSGAAFLQSAALVLLAILIFYSLFRSGFNLKFSDPNLAIHQMSATTLVILYTMYAADGGRPVFVILLMMAFLFSVLQLSSRALIRCAAGILTGYAAVIGLLWQFKRHSLNLPLELLQWMSLALTLPWFAMMGGFISKLRSRLRQNNLDLAAQKAALILAHDEASAARATLVDAIESMADAFALFNAEDHLVLCNRKYVQSFTSFSHFEDIAGMRFEDLVRLSLDKGEVIEAAFEGNREAWIIERIRRHRQPEPEPSMFQLGDGRWFHANEQHTRNGGIVGIRRDISAQKGIEQRQAMEHAVTLLLAQSDTLSLAIPKIIQTMCEMLEWDCGICWQWDKAEQRLQYSAGWSVALDEVMAFVAQDKQAGTTVGETELIQRVWNKDEPIWIADISKPEHPSDTSVSLSSGTAAKAGLRSAFAFPIKIGTELYGVMKFYARDSRKSDAALLDVTRSIGLQIGQFIGRKAAEDAIWQLAFYDQLTCLPNRRLLIDRLQLVVARNTRHKELSALLFIDLDNFKIINDTLGHDKGDLLLQQVANRLVSCVRAADTVARQGGDEFVVMINELSTNSEEAALQAEVIGEKILTHLNLPYQLGEHVYRSTLSIGIALFDGHASADDLLKRADLAMYQAKSAGRNTLRFFEPQMQAAVTARAELESDLRLGQQDAQFVLFYQAQVDRNGHWTGAEALIRWQHPERGLVPPAEFIAAAEETGLILSLGHWVIETACKQLATWSRRAETSHLTLAVNVSFRQFLQPNFVQQIAAILGSTGVDPHKLKLELTESMLLDNMEDMLVKMRALRALGVRFSLDDFGTGYSSLSHLKRLPLDQLKIDLSFIRDVLTNPKDAAIVRTIVALAQNLDLAVIAEGVETVLQTDFLADNGCDAYQGYLFSRPLPLEQFESLHRMAVASENIADFNIPLAISQP